MQPTGRNPPPMSLCHSLQLVGWSVICQMTKSLASVTISDLRFGPQLSLFGHFRARTHIFWIRNGLKSVNLCESFRNLLLIYCNYKLEVSNNYIFIAYKCKSRANAVANASSALLHLLDFHLFIYHLFLFRSWQRRSRLELHTVS